MADINANSIGNRAGTVTLDLSNLGLGLSGETWVDETANRNLGTEYTNDTGKPIMVTVSGSSNAVNEPLALLLYVNGNVIARTDLAKADTFGVCATSSAIIPDGSSYKLEALNATNPTITNWSELK